MTKESRFYQYMYYTLVLFALASNIAPAATAVAIGIGTLLVIYHRIALKTWPAFDKGLVRAFGIFVGVHIAGLTDANFLSVPMMRELWFLVGISLIADELRCRV